MKNMVGARFIAPAINLAPTMFRAFRALAIFSHVFSQIIGVGVASTRRNVGEPHGTRKI